MVKEEETPVKAPAETHAPVQTATDGGLPLVSMILGIISLAMFMLFLGIPALILGIIGLKKYPMNRAFSITGIVTGAISTLIMLGLIMLVIFGVFAAMLSDPNGQSDSSDYYYDSREHRMERPGREGA